MEGQQNLMDGFFSGVILMACLHGILLASIFLFNKKLNAKSNKYLAVAILGICVILGYECTYWLDIDEQVPLVIQYLPIYIRSLVPVGIYFFVVFLIEPEHQITPFEKLGFLIIILEGLQNLVYIPIELIITGEEALEDADYYLEIIGWTMGVIAAVVFLPRALKVVNSYQKFLLDNYSTTNKRSLRWLQVFLILMLVTTLIWIVSFIQYLFGYWDAGELTFSIVTVCLVVLLFWIGYFLVLHYNWFEIAPLKKQNLTEDSQSGKLSSNTVHYYNRLKQLLQEEKIYEDVNLTLDNLSEQLQISSGYLSQIIKEKEQKNFFEFINAYRVESVKAKLLNTDYSNYTIMGIALESGFNSKSTFNSVFKKFTNETPSAFKRKNVLGQ